MNLKIRVVIPAAGKSTRINSSMRKSGRGEISKALLALGRKPVAFKLVESVRKSGIDLRPVIVVSEATGQEVRRVLGSDCDYVTQKERLGTAHSVSCAESILRDNAEAVMVVYADMPLITPQTLRAIADTHARERPAITMGTVTADDFKDWRGCLYTYGHVVRRLGKVIAVVELKDATPAQRRIKEVSPSFFCFNAEWLWANLPKVGRRNVQGEYYLPDLVGIAIQQGRKVRTVPVCPIEAVGINTLEELALAEKLTKRKGGIR